MSIIHSTAKIRLNAYPVQVSGLVRFYRTRKINSFLVLISELVKNSDRNFSRATIAKNFI